MHARSHCVARVMHHGGLRRRAWGFGHRICVLAVGSVLDPQGSLFAIRHGCSTEGRGSSSEP